MNRYDEPIQDVFQYLNIEFEESQVFLGSWELEFTQNDNEIVSRERNYRVYLNLINPLKSKRFYAGSLGLCSIEKVLSIDEEYQNVTVMISHDHGQSEVHFQREKDVSVLSSLSDKFVNAYSPKAIE